MIDMDIERRLFEVWWRHVNGLAADKMLQRKANGEYHYMAANLQWDAWMRRADMAT